MDSASPAIDGVRSPTELALRGGKTLGSIATLAGNVRFSSDTGATETPGR